MLEVREAVNGAAFSVTCSPFLSIRIEETDCPLQKWDYVPGSIFMKPKF